MGHYGQEVLNALRKNHPEYAYKEATLNPTNLQDRAMDWESDLIQQFRNDAHQAEIIGERDTPTGRSLYLARPIRAEAQCLVCHSLPAAAPVTLIQRYGANNGFGWQVHEVVGAQDSVPLASAAPAPAASSQRHEFDRHHPW
jgi:protein-histidine pros-kinase